MASEQGLRFLFDIQDKITAKLAKIEAKSKASAAKINSAFTKASKAQEANASKVIHTEKLRAIAVENATAKATAARTKETQQGKILAQRLSAAQSREARQAERAISTAAKARARVVIKAEKDHERALKVRAREQQRASEASVDMARKSAFVLAALGAALAATSVKLIALGSDAEETENVTGLAFGAMKGEAEKWAASFAASTGSSRFESVELVSDLGLIVKGMGFTEKASLGMSSRMVELAADMASAKNVPLDVALDKIRAGLIGESEPLRTMGVLLSEARVKQEAYASGLAKTGTELTNTQKVQARMNIILADSAAMHGDLINTQDSVANQWRAIKNRVFDAATALGQKLLPAASEVLGVLGEWVKKGADLITWVMKSEKRMKIFGAILAGVVVAGLGLAAAALWALVPAITAATGGLNLIIPLIAVAVGALVAGWILFGDTIKDFLRKVWAKMLDKIGAGLKTLSKFVGIFNDDWADAMASASEGLQDTAADMRKTEKATEKLAKKHEATTKATVAGTEATKKLTKEQIKAQKAAEDSAKAVKALKDTWTGATLKSGEFLRAFEKLTPEQKENDRIMDQVLSTYDSMRKVLGPFNDELEHQWRMTERLNPELAAQRKETEELEKAAKKLADKALKELNKEQEKLKKVAEELNDRLENQRRRLLGLPLDDAIQSFDELTRTWEGLNEAEREVATKEYAKALTAAAKAGNTLDDAQLAIIESTKTAKAEASGYGLALAGLAGQMGGASGQALNLVIAMREHNKEQKKAAALGKKTEGSFGKMRMGAAGLATAFSAVGEMVGGTAGKVLTEIAGIAKAFATGGLVAGIIAGAMALGKAIFGLFSRGKKKRAAAAKKEAAAAKIVADAAKAAADTHAEAVEGLRLAWLNLPTDQIVLDLTAIREAWDALGVEDRTLAFGDYAQSLISARDAGAELTAAELNVITLFEEHQGKRTAMLARHKAEMAGFDTQIAALESLLGTKISEVDALIAQQEAELNALSARQDAEIAALASRRAAALGAISARQNAEMSALLARQEAELGGLDTQIDALEARLYPKISELQMLLDQQEAELAALSTRQEEEMAALATRRKAALDSIMTAQAAQLSLLQETQSKALSEMKAAQAAELGLIKAARAAALGVIKATQAEQLSILKETQGKELDELKATQAAELGLIKAARAAALGVVESAIQRELEDERIAAQLKIDLRKAGGDQEAIDAAHARAATSTERLLERDELNDLMAEAEARVRARYQDELDMVTEYWDAKEGVTTERFQGELTSLEEAHGEQLTKVEAAHATELAAINEFWDMREQILAVRQAHELTELDAAHADELTALESAHAAELAEHNAYWDAKEELTTLRHAAELTALETAHTVQLQALLDSLRERQAELEASHALELTALEVAHAAELAEHNDYWDDLEELMTLRHGVELENLKDAHTVQLEALLASLVERRDALRNSHTTELADLDDFHDAKIRAILAAQVRERDARRAAAARTTTVVPPQNPYGGGIPGIHGDIPGDQGYLGRQHGGPVSSGRPYIVGEAGPEMFVPSGSGRIEPNGSSGGGMDAKALGRAVADALEGTEIKVDGRKLGRLTVRHQPLAVTELGGRR